MDMTTACNQTEGGLKWDDQYTSLQVNIVVGKPHVQLMCKFNHDHWTETNWGKTVKKSWFQQQCLVLLRLEVYVEHKISNVSLDHSVLQVQSHLEAILFTFTTYTFTVEQTQRASG